MNRLMKLRAEGFSRHGVAGVADHLDNSRSFGSVRHFVLTAPEPGAIEEVHLAQSGQRFATVSGIIGRLRSARQIGFKLDPVEAFDRVVRVGFGEEINFCVRDVVEVEPHGPDELGGLRQNNPSVGQVIRRKPVFGDDPGSRLVADMVLGLGRRPRGIRREKQSGERGETEADGRGSPQKQKLSHEKSPCFDGSAP